jgi:hypothetical protein
MLGSVMAKSPPLLFRWHWILIQDLDSPTLQCSLPKKISTSTKVMYWTHDQNSGSLQKIISYKRVSCFPEKKSAVSRKSLATRWLRKIWTDMFPWWSGCCLEDIVSDKKTVEKLDLTCLGSLYTRAEGP